MKIFSSSHEFDYSWDEVSTANWQKYSPWNNKSTHVVAVDTISRTLDPETGILRSERLITCRQPAPRWLTTFIGQNDLSHVLETSYVDRDAKEVTMLSRNLTWSDLITCNETVVYRPSSTSGGGGDPNASTAFTQRAEIVALCGGWAKVRSKIEEVSINQFRSNALRGREGFEAVLEMSRRCFADEREKRRLLDAGMGESGPVMG